MPWTDNEAREHVAWVEGALERVESIEDAGARDTALAAIQALVDLYGEGLSRMVGAVATHGRKGDGAIRDGFIADELIAHLLLLHGLHPSSVEERVGSALADVRPYLHSHGGNVELVGVTDGIVHLRLEGSCKGCPSSSLTLRTAVEEAIRSAAPEIVSIEEERNVRPQDEIPALVSLTRASYAGPTPWPTTAPLTSDAA